MAPCAWKVVRIAREVKALAPAASSWARGNESRSSTGIFSIIGRESSVCLSTQMRPARRCAHSLQLKTAKVKDAQANSDYEALSHVLANVIDLPARWIHDVAMIPPSARGANIECGDEPVYRQANRIGIQQCIGQTD